MSERSATPTADIIKRQKIAANPLSSVWVEANAGSGKTHVLVERVLRLLLEKVPPQNILCLTYTNAAAAEMRIRISKKLASWTLMSDEELIIELTELTLKKIDIKTLKTARILFATALETPGGLKVNTIHAFCESVLHRFSLEAKVPLNFSVMEQSERDDLIDNAYQKVFAKALQNRGKNIASVKWLFANLSDHQISEAIKSAISDSSLLSEVLGDKQGAKQRLKDLVGDEAASVKELTEQLVSETFLTKEILVTLVNELNGDPTGNRRFVDLLSRININNIELSDLERAFLTAKGERKKSLLLKKEKQAFPDISNIIEAEAQRINDLKGRIKRILLIERSSAFIDVLGEIFENYNKQKINRSMLDFDDLIERVVYLFTTGAEMDWVLYKLDANISHILVDESQDTNSQQWVIVKKLCEEFFVGSSSQDCKRTLFAVGDKKQSIFSFQGAKPSLFGQSGIEIKLKAKAAKKPFTQVELKASFRTLPNILKAIDLVCKQDGISNSLLAGDHEITHESARDDKGGVITLWPPIKQQDVILPPDRWPLEKDAMEVRNAARIVATNIVENIESWIKNKRPLGQRGRAVRADDILILVQSRKALFQEIIRALKNKKIKTPGSDKISLSNHIAVQDLLALADILLNPADDLNLAAVLRSPLFDIDEDDLFNLAANRGEISLWQSLKISKNKKAINAYKILKSWRNRLDFDRPYEFFAQILYSYGGLKKFHARLGLEVDDVLSEFLDLALAHEQKPQPSIMGFLNFMRNSDISITRELGSNSNGVRIMTIHGAKGLEAPIVILADAATGANVTKFGKPINFAKTIDGLTLVHGAKKDDFCENTAYLRQADADNEMAEYWRKLYVAMTRAEDELYVTGILTKKGKIEKTWYHTIAQALESQSEKFEIENSDARGLIFPKERPKPLAIKTQQKEQKKTSLVFDPKLTFTSDAKIIIRPSLDQESKEENSIALHAKDNSIALHARENSIALHAKEKGIALHSLLEHLVKYKNDKRREVGLQALKIILPLNSDLHEELINKAVQILGAEQFSHIFGSNSRAEVPFLIKALKNEKQVMIAGRIDRLVIEEKEILLVDYKSDADVPKNEKEIPAQYTTQLGLYWLAGKKLFPNQKVKAAILWTSAQKLMILNENDIKKAVANYSLL